MFHLNKKSILITGATGHIGRQLAHGLSRLGGHVYVNSRTKETCDQLVDEIKESGGLASSACFDVTKDSDVRNFVNSLDSLDVLVNNSYAGRGGTLVSADTDDYLESYRSSVVASANLVKSLFPKFQIAVKNHGFASVINIASMYGMVAPDQRIYETTEGTNPPFYGSAKAALIQFTKYAACELAKENIRVNSISPGPFPTKEVQEKSAKMVDQIVAKVPMGRIGDPKELIGPVAFLASEASSFVTGANITVDGGWTAW